MKYQYFNVYCVVVNESNAQECCWMGGGPDREKAEFLCTGLTNAGLTIILWIDTPGVKAFGFLWSNK